MASMASMASMATDSLTFMLSSSGDQHLMVQATGLCSCAYARVLPRGNASLNTLKPLKGIGVDHVHLGILQCAAVQLHGKKLLF